MNKAAREIALSPERTELLARMLQQKGIRASRRRTVSRRSTEGPIPLSYAQSRLWFMHHLEPGNSSYNIPITMRLIGPLDVNALTQTLNEIVRRHEVLRTTFVMTDKEPLQVVASARTIQLPVLDLSPLERSAREAEVVELVTAGGRYSFDLSREFLFRASLLRLGEKEHVVSLVIHHIVSDGWSMSVLVRELEILYAAFSTGRLSPLPELPIQYADYALWQRQPAQEEQISQQVEYWKVQLADAPPLLNFPTDRPRPAVQSSRGAREAFVLSPGLTEALKTLSVEHEVTLFMTLLGAFQVLLMRYAGQEQISVGSPIAGRNYVQTEDLIGLFATTLVLHTDLRGDPPFAELLTRVRETALGAYAHQDVPFERLVEELQPARSLAQSPLFQVMFVLQNTPQPKLEIAGLRLDPIGIEATRTKFDLTLSVVEGTSGLKAVFEYNTDLFDIGTIKRLAGNLKVLLQSVVKEPEQRLSRLSLLTAAEEEQIERWNSTTSEYNREQCLHDCFEAQVARTPDSVALVVGDLRYCYRELEERANRLAHYLRELDVGPEMLVGILMDRSVEMVVALLAVLKAGAGYVPLDPAYPRQRLRWMLEDSAVAVLLTESKYDETLLQHGVRIVCMDTDSAAIAQHSSQQLDVGVTANNLAYVIYTSGSTGRPKGVAIEHQSVVALIHWAHKCFSSDQLAGVLASTSICFDLSVFELFGPLCAGGTVILADNVLALPLLSAASEVTLINTVPSAFAELLRSDYVPETVRTINLAGEALSQKLAQAVQQQGSVSALYNLYGPTEDTTYSTCSLVPLESDRAPTIGRPIANTKAHVLDRHLHLVPMGIIGDLYLSGDGLARGYLNRPILTSEKFIPNPFDHNGGGRLYKTGDLGRYRSDGELEYIGRTDHQVKIRGYRIELAEIEAVLAQHPAIREAVVISRENDTGEKSLLACLVTRKDIAVPNIRELRDYLKQQLAEYMVPTSFSFIDKLPLSPNGKVNRDALDQGPVIAPPLETRCVPARDFIELRLLRIWEEVLSIRPISVTDNFFEIGGHSLLALRVVSVIAKQFGRNLSLTSFFQAATIEQLASLLRRRNDQVEQKSLVEIQSLGFKRPFFCIHPASGNVLCYLDLARHLDPDRPFYSFKSKGLDELEPPISDIATMANRYIEELLKVQPEGFYLLGGYSMGGIVAFEMAQQLQARGKSVRLLALLDTQAPDRETKLQLEDHDGLMISFARELGLSFESLTLSSDRLSNPNLDEKLTYVLAAATRQRLLPADIEQEQIRRLWQVFYTNARARQNYIPQVYPGRLTLFNARDGRPGNSGDSSNGWNQVAAGGIDIKELPGDHYSMVREPHVRSLSELLNACLTLVDE
jgi:amino acid adenylation domain-containing protein